MGKLSCEAVNYLKVLLSVYSHLLARQSPEDLASVSQLRNGDTYDFIIVGGGTAGCVVANRLSEVKEWKILLLEAGGEEPQVSHIPAFGNNLKLTPLDWQFWTEPQKTACGGQPCQWPGGKVLGGGSAINDMIYNRGNKYDYEGWAKLGNTGWDYANVLPYFRKSEHNLDEDIGTNQIHHSIGGYQTISRFPHVDTNIQLMIKGFTDLGLKVVDFNGEQVLGAAHLQATQSGGERRSTNRAFLEPIRQHRTNIKIVTNVRVIKVLVKPGTKTAYGIKYVGEKENTITGKIFAKKDVILSAGSINSPHILLLSGIGPKETLERLNIPVIKNLRVGYNLQDHVGASAVNFIVGNSTRPNKKDLIRDGFLYSKIPREGGWAGIGSLSVTSYFNSKYADTSIDFPDVQFSTIPSLADVKDQECDVDFDIPWSYYNRVTFMPSVLRPKSKGYLTINTTDPFKHPIIYAKYFDHPDDMKIMVDGFKLVAKLSETKTFIEHGFELDKTSPRRCKHLKFGTDEYWICAAEETTHSNFHPVGTCKMGPSSDPEAVVDPKLHVYGIKHLRVIDSSIMPIVSSGNTNAPSIMIGEKGADLVKESYGIGLKEDDDAYQSVTDDYEEVQFTGDDIQLNTDFIDNNEENRQPKEDEFEIPAHEDEHEGHLHMRRKRSTQPEHIINEKLKKAGKLGGRRGEFEEGEEIEEKENGTGRNKGESEGEEEEEIKNEEEDEDENNFERRTKRSIQPNNRNGKKLMSGTELEGRKGKSEKIRGLEEDEKEKQEEEEEAENEEDETGDEYNDEKEGREEEGDEYDEHDGGDDEKVSDEYEGVIGPKEDDDRHQTITVDNGETPVLRNEMEKDEEDIQNNLQTRTKRRIKSTHENGNKLKKGGEFGGKRGEFDDGEEVENKENVARKGRGHAGKKNETEEGEDEEDENKDAKEENNSKRRTKRNIQRGRKHGKELKKNGKFRESKGEFEEEDEVEKKEFGAGSKKKQKRNRKHRSKKQDSEEGEREDEENDSGEEDEEEENNSKKRTKRNIQTEHRNRKKLRKGEFEEGDEIEKKEFETGIKKKQKGNRKSEGKEEESEEGGEENENGEEGEEEEEGEESGEKEENNLKSRKKRSNRTKHTNERIKGEKLGERRGEFEEGEVENEEHSTGSKKKLKKRRKRGDKKEESEEGEEEEGRNDSGEDEEEEGKGNEKED